MATFTAFMDKNGIVPGHIKFTLVLKNSAVLHLGQRNFGQRNIGQLSILNHELAQWFYSLVCKDLSKVKPGFKSIPLQIYFEIAGLARAEKWREIQNIVGEERF